MCRGDPFLWPQNDNVLMMSVIFGFDFPRMDLFPENRAVFDEDGRMLAAISTHNHP